MSFRPVATQFLTLFVSEDEGSTWTAGDSADVGSYFRLARRGDTLFALYALTEYHISAWTRISVDDGVSWAGSARGRRFIRGTIREYIGSRFPILASRTIGPIRKRANTSCIPWPRWEEPGATTIARPLRPRSPARGAPGRFRIRAWRSPGTGIRVDSKGAARPLP